MPHWGTSNEYLQHLSLRRIQNSEKYHVPRLIWSYEWPRSACLDWLSTYETWAVFSNSISNDLRGLVVGFLLSMLQFISSLQSPHSSAPLHLQSWYIHLPLSQMKSSVPQGGVTVKKSNIFALNIFAKCADKGRIVQLTKVLLMSTHNIWFLQEIRKISLFRQVNLGWMSGFWSFTCLWTSNKIW